MDNWISARVHVLDNSSEHDIQALTEDGIVSLAVVLGSSLSLVGLVFAFITYSLFSDLRSAAGTTLMNLLASLFLTQLLFVVGAGGVEAADLCVSLALALHYSRLTVVSWLLVATYDLFRTLRTQSGLIDSPPPSLGGIFWKYTLVGWGLPAICLGGAILIQNGESGGLGESAAASLRSKNCWFPSPRTFTLTFLIPYWMYLSSTIYYTVRNVFAIRLAAAFAPSRKVQLKLTRRRRLQLLLFVRILLYICLVISCGGISLLLETRIPWVMFAVGSSLQGIFVALSVTCNCQVLKLYTRFSNGVVVLLTPTLLFALRIPTTRSTWIDPALVQTEPSLDIPCESKSTVASKITNNVAFNYSCVEGLTSLGQENQTAVENGGKTVQFYAFQIFVLALITLFLATLEFLLNSWD